MVKKEAHVIVQELLDHKEFDGNKMKLALALNSSTTAIQNWLNLHPPSRMSTDSINRCANKYKIKLEE